MLETKEMKVRVTFTEEVLGSMPGDPEIARSYVASKSEDAAKIEEEIEMIGVDGVVEKQKTYFHHLPGGQPCLLDYQIKGFFKSACQALNMAYPKTKLPAYKRKIDQLVFVKERLIPFCLPIKTEIGECQRPLRASTAQGERVALANSETVPAGTFIEFTIVTLADPEAKKNEMMDRVCEWLDYGQFMGIGQWRSSGKGRFDWKPVEE